MRRRDALIFGGVAAVTLAIPPLLRRREAAFEFLPMRGLPGFRMLHSGRLSGAADIFAGLETPQETRARTRLPANLCEVIFPVAIPPGDVPIAVFSDYNCPHCATLDKRLADLQADVAGLVLVFHELPLLGARSDYAARVALAAARQGDHQAIHLDMMQRALRPGAAGLRDLARRHGLDAAQLAQDLQSPGIADQVQDARALGRALGLPGTPGMVVGRTVVSGALAQHDLKRLIDLERGTNRSPCIRT